jgi:hypothetical protein
MDAETADGARNYSSYVLPGLAKRIHRGDTSRNFYALPAVVQKQDAIGWQSFLEGRPLLGWSEVQHRYYEFLDSRRTGLRWLTALIQKLWDVAWDMWDHRNRVLHDQEHSVARDLQIQQITDEFATGSVGLAREAKLLFSGGLQSLLQRLPAYQTAWLIRIQAARARAERRDGQRQAHQRDTFNPERLGMQRWLGPILEGIEMKKTKRKKKMAVT